VLVATCGLPLSRPFFLPYRRASCAATGTTSSSWPPQYSCFSRSPCLLGYRCQYGKMHVDCIDRQVQTAAYCEFPDTICVSSGA
jgi:hypothetical protein